MNKIVRFDNGVYDGGALLVCQENGVNYYKREGFGVMNYQGGMKYEGDWVNNQRSGKGKIFYNDGDVYVGTFCKDKKHGDGVLYRVNGDVYKMTFVMDKLVSREKVPNKARNIGVAIVETFEATAER